MVTSKQMDVLNKHNLDAYKVSKLVNNKLLIETSAGSLFVLNELTLSYVGQLES